MSDNLRLADCDQKVDYLKTQISELEETVERVKAVFAAHDQATQHTGGSEWDDGYRQAGYDVTVALTRAACDETNPECRCTDCVLAGSDFVDLT